MISLRAKKRMNVLFSKHSGSGNICTTSEEWSLTLSCFRVLLLSLKILPKNPLNVFSLILKCASLFTPSVPTSLAKVWRSIMICLSSLSVKSLQISMSSKYLLSSDNPVEVKWRLSLSFSVEEMSFSDFRISSSPVVTLLFLRGCFNLRSGLVGSSNASTLNSVYLAVSTDPSGKKSAISSSLTFCTERSALK